MVSDMLNSLRCSVAAVVLIGILGGATLVSPAMAQSAAEISVRMSQMEDEMRQLMGQVEQLTYEVKQLKGQLGKTDTGAADPVAPAGQPAPKPRKLAAQQQAAPTQAPQDGTQTAGQSGAAAGGQGIEQIQDQPLAQASGNQTYMKTVVNPDGSESQIAIKKAPGPKILGSLNGSTAAASGNDGGFQGQVLVAPAQQEAGADAGIAQTQGGGDAAAAGNDTSIETVSLSPDTPEALYERSNESLLRRQFGDAEAGFRTFLEKYPEHSLAGSAQYWLGETYYAQNDFRQAAQAFLRGYRQFPDSRRAADSLLKLGISLDRLGQKQQACAAYSSVSSEYPKAVEARKRAQAEAKRAACPA